MTFKLEEDSAFFKLVPGSFPKNQKINDCSTSNYQASIVAYGETRRDGFDDALFLDKKIIFPNSEASGANILVYKKDKFH